MRPRTAVIAGIALLAAAQAAAWLSAPPPDRDRYALPPGEFAGTLMLGGFRGLACDLLWLRAVSAKEAGRYYESVALAETITRVQPRFIDVWQFLAHDLAYNIAYEADGDDGKWAWFLAGVRANVRGCERNPDSERLLRHLAWMLHHKGDNFHARIEAQDWRPLVGDLLVRAGGGSVPSTGLSNFQLAERLYRACIALAQREGAFLNPFVRRMVAHSVDNDGNRLRNRGEHLAALRRWLDCLDAWSEVETWARQPAAEAEERNRRALCLDAMERNEGRVRRKAAALALLLAPDAAAGETAAIAIAERRTADARTLLAASGWKSTAGSQGRIVFLDE